MSSKARSMHLDVWRKLRTPSPSELFERVLMPEHFHLLIKWICFAPLRLTHARFFICHSGCFQHGRWPSLKLAADKQEPVAAGAAILRVSDLWPEVRGWQDLPASAEHSDGSARTTGTRGSQTCSITPSWSLPTQIDCCRDRVFAITSTLLRTAEATE